MGTLNLLSLIAKFLKTTGPFLCKTNTLIDLTTLSDAIFTSRQSGQESTGFLWEWDGK